MSIEAWGTNERIAGTSARGFQERRAGAGVGQGVNNSSTS